MAVPLVGGQENVSSLTALKVEYGLALSMMSFAEGELSVTVVAASPQSHVVDLRL